MSQGAFLSWDEMQRMALPANATLLIQSPTEPVEVACLAVGPSNPHPDWLDDGSFASSQTADSVPIDSAAARSAAEQAEYGSGPVRLIANLIAYNAVLEYALSPRKEEKKEKRALPEAPNSD